MIVLFLIYQYVGASKTDFFDKVAYDAEEARIVLAANISGRE